MGSGATLRLGKLFVTCYMPTSMWFRAEAKAGCLSFPTELKTDRPSVQIQSHYLPPPLLAPAALPGHVGAASTQGEQTPPFVTYQVVCGTW